MGGPKRRLVSAHPRVGNHPEGEVVPRFTRDDGEVLVSKMYRMRRCPSLCSG